RSAKSSPPPASASTDRPSAAVGPGQSVRCASRVPSSSAYGLRRPSSTAAGPASSPATARTAGGTSIDAAIGVGWTGSTPGRSANAPQRKRALYATVSTVPATSPASSTGSSVNAAKTASLATNPTSGGTPAIDAAAS